MRRPHATEQLPGEGFQSVGDGASSGAYTSGGGSDEPIDRASFGDTLFDQRPYQRPFGYYLTSNQRQLGRQWTRRILQEQFGRNYF